MLQLITELAEAVRLIVGSFTGTGYDPSFLPIGYWNECIDLGAVLRMITDTITGA